MKQSGRASLLTIAAIACILLIAVMVLFSRESLASVGGRFMVALQKGDADTLAKMSYLGNKSEDQMRKDWDFAVHTAAPYYHFVWRITSTKQIDAKTGTVSLGITRNFDTPGSYEENFQLPLAKVGDEWKVVIPEISRELYPGLPR